MTSSSLARDVLPRFSQVSAFKENLLPILKLNIFYYRSDPGLQALELGHVAASVGLAGAGAEEAAG